MELNVGLLRLIRYSFENGIERKRDFENIEKFFNMIEKGEYTLDNQTWEDLDMNSVYEKLDRNFSSPGQSALYSMLRNPLMDEKGLTGRGRTIENFGKDTELRERLQSIYFKLGRDTKNSLLNMIDKDLVNNRTKYYIYTFIGKVIPIILVLLSIFIDARFMTGLLALGVLNMFINSSESSNIKSDGILYLRRLIKSAKKISAIEKESFALHRESIEKRLKLIRDIDRATRLIGFINMWGGIFEPISIVFLLEETIYYAISDKIREKKDILMELYNAVGEVEALISICSYQHGLKQSFVKPTFTEEISLKISGGVHPLIESPVANSIFIKDKGIVLTGTNMSGKSTFLRMLGVNILLAQTFYFALAEEYEAPFFNVVTSISPKDDITKGKSFYMAEVESVLRIIKALDKGIPVFCPIDELFRGTNPVERISMAAEILAYINNGKTVSIAATHDRELVDILKENYEFYYFSEKVDSQSGLSFDYKLKRGASQTRNAIKLLEYMKYPREIIEGAFERAKGLEGVL